MTNLLCHMISGYKLKKNNLSYIRYIEDVFYNINYKTKLII